jgi:hypothetical protein
MIMLPISKNKAESKNYQEKKKSITNGNCTFSMAQQLRKEISRK